MEMNIKNSLAYIRHHMTIKEAREYRKARLSAYIALCDEGGLIDNINDRLKFQKKLSRLAERITKEDRYRRASR